MRTGIQLPSICSHSLRHLPLTILVFCLSVSTGNASFDRKVGSEIYLGTNLVGEQCRAVLERQREKYDYSRHRVYCGAWEEASATVNSWTFKKQRTNSAWRDRQEYWWRPYIDGKYDCVAGQDSEILDDVHIATLDCKTRDGGFDYKAYVGKIDRRIFFVDYIPANANVVATLSGIVSDVVEPDNIEVGSKSRLVAALEEQAASGEFSFYGAGAYGGFKAAFELGRILNHAHEPARAIAAFKKALSYHEQIFGEGAPSSGAVLARIGNDYRNLGDLETSLSYLDRADVLLSRTNDRNNQAELLVYRSYLASEKGHLEEAVAYAEQAHDIRVGYWKNKNGWIAHAKYAVARALYEAERQDEATSYAEDSLRYYEELYGQSHHWPANLRLLLGRIAAKQGEYSDAMAYMSDAITIRESLFGKTLPYATALWHRAAAHALNGNGAASREDFSTAVRAVSQADLASRLQRASLNSDDLVWAIEKVLSATDDNEQVNFPALLEAVQLPKRGIAKSVVSQMAARFAAGNQETADLTRRLQELASDREDLRYRLGQITGNNDGKVDKEEAALLSDRLTRIESEVSALSGELQGRFPTYAQLVKPLPVTLEELSELLEPGEAMVRFLVGHESTLTLLSDGNRVFLNAAPIGRNELAEQIDALRLSLEAGVSEPFSMRRSHALFRTLFGDLSEMLVSFSHVFFVPDGALSSFPPGLFVLGDPPKNVRDYASANWVAAQFTISVLPTIGSLRDLRKVSAKSKAEKPFLGIGNPVFSTDASTAPQIGETCQNEGIASIPTGLSPLPETADELRDIAQSTKASEEDLMLGEKANEAAVKALDLKSYRGIAFATHGLLPSEIHCGEEPGLVLTAPSQASSADNGILTASEIFDLELDADWILLSACNTGRVNGGFGGESLSSLASGFFFAGSRMVIASHWPVVSDTTVDLTTTMLTGAQQTSLSEGLRQSQLNMMKDPATAHPVFWAPFVIYGDGTR